MCSGRVDLAFVLRAFANGQDGVFIGGCWPGECHYITDGNYHALNMVTFCKKLLEHIGINPERLRIEWISASEGIRFSEIMNDFSQKLTDLGPLGKNEGMEEEELKAKIAEVTKLLPYIKLEKKEKLSLRFETEQEYKELYTTEEVEKLFTETASYYIDPEKCMACGICRRKCPVEAIEGAKNQIHVIDQNLCIKCGTCFEACPSKFEAISKIIGEDVPLPIPEEERTIAKKAKGK